MIAQPKAEAYPYDLTYFLPKGNYTYNPDIPTPEQALGFQIGQQHADWGQVVAYMKALAEASDRVTVREASLPEICREMYFVVRGQRLDVQYWYPIYNRRGWLEIFCRMVQGEVPYNGT